MSEWLINHYHDEVLTDSRFHTPLAIYGISKSINWKKSSENANVSVYFYKKEYNLYFFLLSENLQINDNFWNK